MKIILSPAKEQDLSHPLTEEWDLSAKSQQIVDQVKSLEGGELQKALKLSDKQVGPVQEMIAAFDQKTTYPAIQLYHGLAFRQFDLENLTASQEDYLADHVVVLSALYGPISVFTPIKAYRLDFTMPLRIDGQSLRQYWKGSFDQAFQPGEVVVNLASQEYASMLQVDRYDWLEVEFCQYRQGKLKKAPSATAKKLRGKMANALVHDQAESIEALKTFQAEGFTYAPSASKEGLLVFIQDEEDQT